jgi:hypothetical protein
MVEAEPENRAQDRKHYRMMHRVPFAGDVAIMYKPPEPI